MQYTESMGVRKLCTNHQDHAPNVFFSLLLWKEMVQVPKIYQKNLQKLTYQRNTSNKMLLL